MKKNKTDLVKTNLNISAETYNQYISKIEVVKGGICGINKKRQQHGIRAGNKKKNFGICAGNCGSKTPRFAKKAIITNSIDRYFKKRNKLY